MFNWSPKFPVKPTPPDDNLLKQDVSNYNSLDVKHLRQITGQVNKDEKSVSGTISQFQTMANLVSLNSNLETAIRDLNYKVPRLTTLSKELIHTSTNVRTKVYASINGEN